VPLPYKFSSYLHRTSLLVDLFSKWAFSIIMCVMARELCIECLYEWHSIHTFELATPLIHAFIRSLVWMVHSQTGLSVTVNALPVDDSYHVDVILTSCHLCCQIFLSVTVYCAPYSEATYLIPLRHLCWEQVLFLATSVCLSVCLCVRLSTQNLENCWLEIQHSLVISLV